MLTGNYKCTQVPAKNEACIIFMDNGKIPAKGKAKGKENADA